VGYLITKNGVSIAEISECLNISKESIFDILKFLNRGYFSDLYIYSDSFNFENPNLEVLYNHLKWYIENNNYDQINIECFNDIENIFLTAVIKTIGFKGVYNNKSGSISNIPSNVDILKESFFEIVKESILKSRSAEVTYISKDQKFELLLKPYKLAYNETLNIWYLIAENQDGKVYPYRIDRFKSYKLREKFHITDIKEYDIDGNEKVIVKVIFKNEANVIEKIFVKLHNKGKFELAENGNILFTGLISSIKYFESWIRGLGSSAVVLEPGFLKESLIDSGNKILNNYKDIDYYKELVKQKS
jgi:hypothetical protein